jgi:hypothetical protein
MYGFKESTLLDAFATGVPLTFTTPVDSSNIPLVDKVVI